MGRTPDGDSHPFEIEPFPKECLLKGQDEIALTLEQEPDIARYKRDGNRETP